MAFYTDKTPFTHVGRFYFVPIYINIDDEAPLVAGTNLIYDKLFRIMAIFHNTVVEFSAQTMAWLLGYQYEAGFPFHITGKLIK